MPKPRPPHLHRETTSHGRTVWYVRVVRGPRIRITAAFGTPEFDAEYQAAISGKQRPHHPRRRPLRPRGADDVVREQPRRRESQAVAAEMGGAF